MEYIDLSKQSMRHRVIPIFCARDPSIEISKMADVRVGSWSELFFVNAANRGD